MSWLDDEITVGLSELDLPLRFEAADLSGIPKDSAIKQCTMAYLTKFWDVAPQGIGCLFLGRARQYKTYASAAIARRIHRAGITSLFVQCGVHIAHLDRNRFSNATTRTIQYWNTVPFLVMDDFTQVPEKTFGASVLLEVAESRFSNQRPTLWTGNVGPVGGEWNDVVEVMARMYGAGFSRRVYDGTEGFRVRIL